jgi:adenylate cyclase
VRYVLEGSVRKSGNKVRVTAQLIDAVKGQHLWAESYDRDFENIFEIQDEISMNVVTSLRVELTEGEQARMWQDKNRNPEIYRKQLQLISLWRQGTRESMIRHGRLAQEVVDIAPESAIGYRALGWAHWYLAVRGESPRENYTKAFEFAQKALSIDESNGFSHGLLGSVYLLGKKYEKAIASGKRSIELQPNGAQAHLLLGNTLGYAGRFDEAIVYIKQAIRLNPFPPWFYYYHLGRCYIFKEQFGEALSEFKKAAKRAPESAGPHLMLAITYIYLDRIEEAHASAAKALELSPNFSVSFISKTSKFKNQAHIQYIIDAMRKAGFPE